MSYEVALAAGAVIASVAAIGAAAWLTRRPGVRARASAVSSPEVPAIADGRAGEPGTAEDDSFDRPSLDERSRSALTACMFANAPADQLCWTAMVVDPALHDTPSHIRLVGHYETEFAAIDAAAHLADALNECLVPGEAPLTATAFGIEPAVPPHAGEGHPARRADSAGAEPFAPAPSTPAPLTPAPLTPKPLTPEPLAPAPRGSEPLGSAEPLSHIGMPIAYTGTPLAGHTVLTDLDDAPFGRC